MDAGGQSGGERGGGGGENHRRRQGARAGQREDIGNACRAFGKRRGRRAFVGSGPGDSDL